MSEEVVESKTGLIDKLPWWFVPAILLGVPLLFALGAKVAHEAVYDNIIWKYYWGPIKADAADGVNSLTHHGVTAHAGYNVVNTGSWAVLLGVCIIGIKQILDWGRTKMDATLVVGATMWVVAGSITHVLQDTNLMAKPLEYFYITPPIYLLYGLGGIASFVIGHYLKTVATKAHYEIAMQKLWLIMSVPVLLWMFVWIEGTSVIAHVAHPFWLLAFTAATFYLIRRRFDKTQQFDAREFVFFNSIPWIAMSILYAMQFQRNPWDASVIGSNAVPSALWIAPALAAGATLLVYLVAKGLHKRNVKHAASFFVGINLLIIFGQTLDGFATSLGLDVAGYEEKHVLSAWVIDSFHDFSVNIGFGFGAKYPTFLAFAPLKLAISIAVVYALDKEAKPGQETLVNLAKFAIIMVGIGPGIRDFVRLAMGV